MKNRTIYAAYTFSAQYPETKKETIKLLKILEERFNLPFLSQLDDAEEILAQLKNIVEFRFEQDDYQHTCNGQQLKKEGTKTPEP